MKIKKYIGSTSHEAMQKLKSELGPNAVVLSTKTTRGKGIFKYFRKPLIEITAAYEEEDVLGRDINNLNNGNIHQINKELLEIKESIKNIPLNTREYEFSSSTLKRYNDILISSGVNSKVSFEILKKIEKDIDLDTKDEETIKKIIKYTLREILGNPKPILFSNEKKVYYFVGATGVGKTTTLAKVASNLVLEEKRNIGLITSDTYRIAAVEQLKTYSKILQLPLEIAYNKNDMIKALDKFKEKDIVLVDTAGRNHNDIEQINELNNILSSSEDKEIFLLISGNLDYELLETLIEKYDFLENFNLIVTKIDESGNYGNILNAKYLTEKELSYYTIGQNVPDDIKIVDVEEIVEKLVEEKKDE